MRNKPPKNNTKSLPEISIGKSAKALEPFSTMPGKYMLKSGAVSFIIKNKEKSSAILANIAKKRPKYLALSRYLGSSLFTNIASKMILSIPSTISSAPRVSKVSQASILNNHSKILILIYEKQDYS